MDKFRTKTWYYEGDFSKDKTRLYEKALDLIDCLDSKERVGKWVELQDAFENKPSINQIKQNIKNILKNKE